MEVMQSYDAANAHEQNMLAEAEREYAERMAPVATLADAHSEWHFVYGRDAVCPLDCGAGEYLNYQYDHDDEEDAPEPVASIRCGHCRNTHHSVAEVRACGTKAAADRTESSR